MPEKRRIDIAGFHNRVALQRGQASVFVIVLVVVVLVGILVLFNTGQLTRHKMEVQNAADAAAYSAGILRARTLNFMAYTNRAMVANEMAIGQFSAFSTWRRKYNLGNDGLTPQLIALRASLNAIPPCFCAGTMLVNSIRLPLTPWRQTADIMGIVPEAIGKGLYGLNYGVNGVYGGFQWAMRASTYAAQMETVPKIISANAPDARLSNFGAIAMALSLAEQRRFIAFAGPKRKVDRYPNAVRRYVALVNRARDRWTRDRGRNILGGYYIVRGGSELRLVGKDGEPGWSSADTVAYSLFSGREIFSMGGAVQERTYKRRRQLGFGYPKVKNWKINGYYGRAADDTPVSMTDAVGLGFQPPAPHLGLSNYHFVDPNNYAAVDEGPVFLIGVRKDVDALATSDQLPEVRRIGGGRLQLRTLAAGVENDAYEGNPGNAVIDEIERAMREFLDDKIGELEPLPFPVNQVIDPQSILDGMIAEVTGQMRPIINELVAPLDQSKGKAGMFALAAARVYYRNPDDEAELGTLFNPYWEVRLQPVDDSVRKWSLVTQDPVFSTLLSYLVSEDLDVEQSGMYGELQRLDDYLQ